MHPLPASPSPPDDNLECVVLDPPTRKPGFYSHGFRTFYIASDGAVYLVRAPGQRATLQQLDDLPSGSHVLDIVIDTVLHHLASAAEAAGRRFARGRLETSEPQKQKGTP
jgi:hypothetical protein